MTNTLPKPSLSRILQADYWAMLALLIPLVALVMYLIVAVFGFFPGLRGGDPIRADGAPLLFWLTIGALVIGLPFAWWRISKVRGIFANGVTVEGNVYQVKFFRDRGSVSYIYHYEGQKHAGYNAISRNKRTSQLMDGQPITLVVDRRNPKSALVRDLYS